MDIGQIKKTTIIGGTGLAVAGGAVVIVGCALAVAGVSSSFASIIGPIIAGSITTVAGGGMTMAILAKMIKDEGKTVTFRALFSKAVEEAGVYDKDL